MNNELTPKDKAIEMLNNYRPLCGGYNGGKLNKVFAKQCALVALRDTIWGYLYQMPTEVQNYWIEVKQEIEKL